MGVLLVNGNPISGDPNRTKIYKMPRLTDTETSLTPLKGFSSFTVTLNDINDNGIIALGNYYANAYDVLTDPLKPSNYQFNQYTMPSGLQMIYYYPLWKLNSNMNVWVYNDRSNKIYKRFFLDFNNYSITNVTERSYYYPHTIFLQSTNNNTTNYFYKSEGDPNRYKISNSDNGIACIIEANTIINNICSEYEYRKIAIFPYNPVDFEYVVPTSVTKTYNFNSYPSFPGYNPYDIKTVDLVHVELSPVAGSNDNVVYYWGEISQYNSSINKYLIIPVIFKFTHGETNLVFTEGTNMWIYPEYAIEHSYEYMHSPSYKGANNAHYYKKYDGNIYMIINKYVNGSQEAYVGIFNPITYQFKIFRLENMRYILNMSIYPNIDESIYTYLPSRASII